MRKILMILIIVLLCALCYFSLFEGLEIGDFQISSIEQIKVKSENLNSKIESTNKLIDSDYPGKIEQLKKASNNMENAKEQYLEYTNLSSDEQILEAMQKKSYAIEFLWTKLGLHARKEGVNLTFEIVTSSTGANNTNDIKFIVDGSYIAITNFVYAIEDDTDLNFRIENFKLLPYQNEILQATFTVRNITVEGNNLAQSNINNNQNIQNDTDKNENTIATDSSEVEKNIETDSNKVKNTNTITE